MSAEANNSGVATGLASGGNGFIEPQVQLELISGESDEALLLPREQAQKMYTASTAAKLEVKRELILALVGCGLPTDFISEKARCSTRTVKLLGAKYAATVASNTRKMAEVLGSLAMEAAFHIREKLAGAKVGELGVVMGIALQRKNEMELSALGAGEEASQAIDMEAEDPDLVKAREYLKTKHQTPKTNAKRQEV